MKIATAAEMTAIDRAAERHGVAVAALMENAGRCIAEAAKIMVGPVRGRRLALFCGTGNNGGDGFVAARALREEGAVPLVVLVGDPEALRADARRAWDAARAAGIELAACGDPGTLAAAAAAAREAELIVDALLGTGFVPPLRELTAAAIALVNSLGPPVLAVDIPSGLRADGGDADAAAVRATATVTFGYPKPGLVLHPGARLVGRLWVADIDFPPETDALVAGDVRLTTAADLAPLLAARDPESHKGTFGAALLVCGSRGMAGAAALAARGALRAGVGLVTVALPASVAPVFLPGLPEAMLLPLADGGFGAVGPDAAAAVVEQLPRTACLAVGPGISRSAASADFVRVLCAAAAGPLVLDADALHALSGTGARAFDGRSAPPVLTPHPGELARLLGTSAAAVQADRVAAARTCAARFGAVVVLKGARSVIAPPEGPAWVNPTGNPAMAAAGMGDVLTGVIAAHLARGMAPLSAALLGTFLHGLAGDLAAPGPWGLLASEVADGIPAAVLSLWSRRDAAPRSKLDLVIP